MHLQKIIAVGQKGLPLLSTISMHDFAKLAALTPHPIKYLCLIGPQNTPCLIPILHLLPPFERTLTHLYFGTMGGSPSSEVPVMGKVKEL
jgi:hypothetical protein